MKTRSSLTSRSGWSRRTRIAVIVLAALLPLTLIAQQGAPQAQRSLLPPGAASPIPFTGPGWQDKVLTHEGYVMPPAELAGAVLAPREMNVTLGNPSPDRKWFLDEIGDGPVPMSVFGRPFDELGGVFIDFKANRQRAVTRRNTIGLQIISAADGSRKTLATPANMRVTNARWTQDGTAVMYMTLADDGSYLWMTDVATNKPRQISKTSLLATFVTNFDVINNGKSIAAVFPPDGRTARPLPPAVPAGPELSISMDADRNRLRTYASLMKTPYDHQLLEWHATGQIGIMDIATGAIAKFGKPAMITAMDVSPDGKYARVTRMTKPFSYIVPVSSFGSIEEVWDAAGTALAKLSERPINLGVQAQTPDPPDPTQPPTQAPAAGGGRGGGGAANNGKRELMWREDGQGFNYLQLEPAPVTTNSGGRGGRAGGNGAGAAGANGGDPPQTGAPPQQGGGQAGGRGANAQQTPRKDRLMHWAPPFTDASAKLIYENPTQMSNVRFSPDGQIMFFTESNNTVAMFLNDMTTKYTIVRGGGRGGDGGGRAGGGGGQAGGRGGQGGDNQAGTLMSAQGAVSPKSIGGGVPVMVSADGTSVYLQSGGGGGGRGGGGGGGRGANATPPKPFVDKVNIKTGEKMRLFEGENTGITESITTVIDPEAKKLVLSRQNATTPPQQFLFDNGNRKQLTNNEDLFPDLTRMVVQRFEVTRADGFTFRTVVYLPSDYKEGTRLPGFFWFYPYEYTSQEQFDNAGNGGASPSFSLTPPNNFPNFGSLTKQFLTRLGYAVIENQSPIVGNAGAMNNNYVNDLRNNLAATIDELDKRMLVDRTRLAIGGHSYGAFSTVNAMVNTPFFKAGIAGDGAYNRTLTPLGFQSERRDLWEAPNVYLDMSPFLRANQLSGALLMYHGMHDQNVGTDPINSDRLFHALNGLGKTVALYRYPFEDHGPASRETLLDLWSRWAAWLDKYVKNPQPLTKPAPAATPNRGGGGGR
jgi:dipeptidyl aminopeptidase/acylaminoacyl peptidase